MKGIPASRNLLGPILDVVQEHVEHANTSAKLVAVSICPFVEPRKLFETVTLWIQVGVGCKAQKKRRCVNPVLNLLVNLLVAIEITLVAPDFKPVRSPDMLGELNNQILLEIINPP